MQRALIVTTFVIAGCGGPSAPAGLDCPGNIRTAADATQLSAAIAASAAGDCVLLESGTYRGPFNILTAGVQLGGAVDATATLTSGPDEVPLTIGGAGVALANFVILGPMSTGLAINTGPVTVTDVSISDARRAAVEIRCEEQGCLLPSARVLLGNVSLERSNSGGFLSGGKVRFEGGRIADNTSASLAGGAGLYATAGVDLELIGTAIEDNLYGLVIDGASSSARLEGVSVARNAERGLWAQGLRGTMLAPSLSITAGTRFDGNGLVAVGVLDSRGVAIRDTQLVDTINKTVPINVVETADIGDGLGLFGGSAEVDIDASELSGNARAQAVVDTAGANIRFGANQIAGALKVVIQASVGTTVVAPETDLTDPAAGMPLPVATSPVALP